MIKARNMMTQEVITVTPNFGIREAAKLATSKSVSSLVVLDNGKPIAVVSERDIIRGSLLKKTKVRDIMSKKFRIISPDTTFYEITRSLKERNIQRFPVVDSGRLIGIITETDIVEATRDFTRFHQIMQDVILAIFGIATAFFLFYFSPLGAALFG
ncbi:CBS domain-containing protein [Candidatus Woesearchaeota archaeon]|nr:CBS domain-containing protein [Candidatus Woesearchaeota archaeon]